MRGLILSLLVTLCSAFLTPSLILRPETLRSAPLFVQENVQIESFDVSSFNQRYLRFAGVGRLFTDFTHADEKSNAETHLYIVDRLYNATVVVIGLGGVGSWAAEALCRSGIGNMILIDLDDICISNTNRQLHALTNTIGKMKIDEMKARLLAINPDCNVTLIHDFVSVDNVHELMDRLGRPTAVLDAIDGSTEKSALLAECTDRKIPIITCGGAAGKIDPTKIVCQDLTQVIGDKLLSSCRTNLRKYHGFPNGLPAHERRKKNGKTKKWGILAIYSQELQKHFPMGDDASSLRRCDGVLGTGVFVTGTFGFVAAARLVEMIAKDQLRLPTR